MKVQHSGPERVYLAPFGDFVEPNTPVEVSDDVGASLIEQGWDIPRSGGPTKAELIDMAAERGVDVKKSWTVDQILAALEEPNDTAAADEQED